MHKTKAEAEAAELVDMGLASYSVDCWACGCLDLGRHPHVGAKMNLVSPGGSRVVRLQGLTCRRWQPTPRPGADGAKLQNERNQ